MSSCPVEQAYALAKIAEYRQSKTTMANNCSGEAPVSKVTAGEVTGKKVAKNLFAVKVNKSCLSAARVPEQTEHEQGRRKTVSAELVCSRKDPENWAVGLSAEIVEIDAKLRAALAVGQSWGGNTPKIGEFEVEMK